VTNPEAVPDPDPDDPAAIAAFARALGGGGRDTEAIGRFEALAARARTPDSRRAAFGALASFRNRAGDAQGALDALAELGAHGDPGLASLGLLFELYAQDWSDAAVVALKRRIDALDPDPCPAPRPARARAGGARVGFAGSNLGALNYMALLAPLLVSFDRARLTPVVVSFARIGGVMGQWYRDRGVEAHDLSALAGDFDAAAARVAALALDVYVDLDDILARPARAVARRRPARAMATWFNMTGPAGDPAFAASIGNAALYPDPSIFPETCVRLPADAFVYDPAFGPIGPSAPSPAPCESGAPVTFGALAQPYKIGTPSLDLWAAALRAAPAARFHLANAGMAEAAARARIAREMAARGVDPDRLSFGTDSGWPGYLKGYARIDLAFATFPVAGGTTMFEAAYQGVPSLSARGHHALARIGDWLARAVEAPWMACADAAEFAARAAELAADPARLIDARRNWRARLREKSRSDTPRVARALEDALLDLSERAP
jgi:protein O-GlcNAc transferase